MESLYLLVPLSVALILATMGIFAWALNAGQFDDLAAEGERVLFDDTQPRVAAVASATPLDLDQAAAPVRAEE